MPPSEKASHSPAKSNVHRLGMEAGEVQPPDGWQLEGKFGHMAYEAGPAGRLERLAEVLRWLQGSRAIPRSEALKVLLEAMHPEVMSCMYWLEQANYATLVPQTAMFGFATAGDIQAKKAADRDAAHKAWRENEWRAERFGSPLTMNNGRISMGYTAPTEPGLPALLKHLQGWWSRSTRGPKSTCDVLDDPTLPWATRLAIRLDKAHELWGYGTVAEKVRPTVPLAVKTPATWVELKRYHADNPGHAWTQAMRQLLSNEDIRRKAAGHTGVRAALAADLEMTHQGISHHIRKLQSGTKSGRGRQSS